MSDTRKSPLNLRFLREEAHLSRGALAERIGMSMQALRGLESGTGNPYLATVFQLALALAGPLGIPPSRVFEELIPDAAYNAHEPLREAAAGRLATIQKRYGSAARQRFATASSGPQGEREPTEYSFYRLQKLYARSRFSQADLIELTGLSDRTIRFFFGVSASTGRNTTLVVFLLITATLAPVYGGTVKETVTHVLGDDLAQLDARYAARTPPA